MWNNAFNYLMKIKNDYINTFGSLDTLSIADMCVRLNTKEYRNFLRCVTITNHNEFNLVKYSLILGGDTDLYTNSNSIYREMRGLCINVLNDEIVLLPFPKFFNINELEETSIDVVKEKIKNAKTFEITNKMDGSMLSVRFYQGKFILGGTGSLHLNGNNPRLDECYLWLTDEYKNMIAENTDKTFLFEYISQNDIHIVNYSEKEQGLYLIGVRDVNNGYVCLYNEVIDYANRYGVKTIVMENSSLDNLISKRGNYKAKEKEGWVLRIDNYMYKIKCEDYIEIHTLLTEKSPPKTIIRNVDNETIDDLLANVPMAYRKNIDSIVNNVYAYIGIRTRMFEKYWKDACHIADDKEFAIHVNSCVPKEYRGYLFAKRKGFEFSFLHSNNGRYVRYYQILDFLKDVDV